MKSLTSMCVFQKSHILGDNREYQVRIAHLRRYPLVNGAAYNQNIMNCGENIGDNHCRNVFPVSYQYTSVLPGGRLIPPF